MSERWPQVQPRPFGTRQTEPWQGVPDNETGALTTVDFILAGSERVTVRVCELIAFSTGFSFECICQTDDSALDHMALVRNREYFEGRRPDRTFRIGLQLPNGIRMTSLDGHASPLPQESLASGPRMKWIWSSGGHYLWWVYPLPAPGLVTFACEWPAADIPFSTAEVERAAIIEATRESVRIR